ncbi:MAG: Ig-like domain-containing protein [Duncaniella sp.]|nr:Ig-like domain-containing protein [Duncaniella sp.]
MKRFVSVVTTIGLALTLSAVEKSFTIEFETGPTIQGIPINQSEEMEYIVTPESVSYVSGYAGDVNNYPVNYQSIGGLFLVGDGNNEGQIAFTIIPPTAPAASTIKSIEVVCGRYTGSTYQNAYFEIGLKTKDNPNTQYPFPEIKDLPAVNATDQLVLRTLSMEGASTVLTLSSLSTITLRSGYENDSHTYVKSLRFVYDDGTKGESSVTFASDSFEASLYGFDQSESPVATTSPEGLTLTYSIADESVAAIDSATGKLSPKAEGTTTVTATFAGNETLESASASYTLKVTDTRTVPTLAYEVEGDWTMMLDDPEGNQPLLNNPSNLSLEYTSSNPEVAKVETGGKITALTLGTTTITAKFAGNDQYLATQATLNLVVDAPEPEDPAVTINGNPVTERTFYFTLGKPLNVVISHQGTVYVSFIPLDENIPDFAPADGEGYTEYNKEANLDINQYGTLHYYGEQYGKRTAARSIEFARENTTAIENLAKDSGDTKYVDLSGRPVATPAPGSVVIRISGNGTSEKVMITEH